MAATVADVFFSRENVAYVNHAMIVGVFERSGRRIGTQSQEELATVMRSVYANEARNLPVDVDGQVAELNDAVVEYCVSTIVDEARMHDFYMRDRDQSRREVPTRAEATSSAGARSENVAATRDFVPPYEPDFA